jgi:hypothetical protein
MSHVELLRNELAELEQAFFNSWPDSPLRQLLSADIACLRSDISAAQSA